MQLPDEIITLILRHCVANAVISSLCDDDREILEENARKSVEAASLVSHQWQNCATYALKKTLRDVQRHHVRNVLTLFIAQHMLRHQDQVGRARIRAVHGQLYEHVYEHTKKRRIERPAMWSIRRYQGFGRALHLYSSDGVTWQRMREIREWYDSHTMRR